jgi:hypothetical protein
MKKKILMFVAVASLSFCAILTFADPGTIMEDPGTGNTATCYSTYTEPIFGVGGTKIWVCGSCVQASAKTFSDSGTCSF